MGGIFRIYISRSMEIPPLKSRVFQVTGREKSKIARDSSRLQKISERFNNLEVRGPRLVMNEESVRFFANPMRMNHLIFAKQNGRESKRYSSIKSLDLFFFSYISVFKAFQTKIDRCNDFEMRILSTDVLLKVYLILLLLNKTRIYHVYMKCDNALVYVSLFLFLLLLFLFFTLFQRSQVAKNNIFFNKDQLLIRKENIQIENIVFVIN